MKAFNKSVSWQKWALAGTLVASLGASISFNPESKFVARNEFKTQGEVELASKVQVTVDDYTEAVGIWDDKDGKLLWNIQKKSDAKADGAEYCITCVTKKTIQSVDLKAMGLTDLAAIQFYMKAKTQEAIATAAKKDSDSTDSVSTSSNTFDHSTKCLSREYVSGSGRDRTTDFSGYLSCLTDDLDASLDKCHKQVDKEIEKKIADDESKNRKRSDRYADRDDSVKYKICDRFALSFTRKSIVPAIKNALSSKDSHQDGLDAIESLLGPGGTLVDVAGVNQLENEISSMVAKADASSTLDYLRSSDTLDQINAKLAMSGTCQAMISDQQSYSNCLQTAQNAALLTESKKYFWNLTSQDMAALRSDRFASPALSIYASTVDTGWKQMGLANVNGTTGTNFATILQNMANGSTLVNGTTNVVTGLTADPSGRVSGRWADGAPGWAAGTNAVNSLNSRSVTNPTNVPALQQSATLLNGGGGNAVVPRIQ